MNRFRLFKYERPVTVALFAVTIFVFAAAGNWDVALCFASLLCVFGYVYRLEDMIEVLEADVEESEVS